MITLEYLTKDDFDILIRWAKTPAFVAQWAGSTFHYPLTNEQLNRYMENANHPYASTYAYKAVDQANRMVGHISLGNIDRDSQIGRIGKVLVGSPEDRGKGIGKDMVEKVLQLAFEDLQLNRVSLGVFDFNRSAIKSYQNAGFQIEGHIREVRKVNGSFWSYYEMSILQREWESLHKK